MSAPCRFIVVAESGQAAPWQVWDSAQDRLSGTFAVEHDAELFAAGREAAAAPVVALRFDAAGAITGACCDCGGEWARGQLPAHEPGCAHHR